MSRRQHESGSSLGRLYQGPTFNRLVVWNSSVNRDQLRDGADILGKLVPVTIHLMMENHGELWGDPCYPVVD